MAAKLVLTQEISGGCEYVFEDTDVSTFSNTLCSLFAAEGYRLEKGSPVSGIYGKGSTVGRLLIGAAAKRFKFKVDVLPEGNGVRLRVVRGMSGASGGLIGWFTMKKELSRIVDKVGTLSVPSSGSEPATSSGGSPAQRLKELNELKSAGIITDEEYETRRQRLVDQL
jgi:hypothetical protein